MGARSHAVDVAEAHAIRLTNLDAITFIQQHGMEDISSRMYSLRRRLGGALVLPLLIFLAAAFYYPLAFTIRQSLQPKKGAGLTLATIRRSLASREGRSVLLLTLFLSLAATVLSLLLVGAAGVDAAPPFCRARGAAVPDHAADGDPGAGRRARAAVPV